MATAKELRKRLEKEGFKFDKDGDITNLEKQLTKLQNSVNKLKDEKKELAKESAEAIYSLIEAYNKLNNETIPDSESSYLEMMDTIKQAEKQRLEYIQDVQDKIADAIKERLEKEADDTKKHLEKMRDLYNDEFDEETYESELRKENRKLDELKQQIANLSRDTSLAGQLKLQQLMDEYEAQQELINNMIRDKEHERGDQAFQDAIDQIDEKLEDVLSEKSLANMVNQALSNGFIKLNGEVVKTETLLTEMLENSGDLFKATGELVRTELIDALKVAQSLMSDISSFTTRTGVGRSIESLSTVDLNLTSRSINERPLEVSASSGNAMSVSLSFDNLLNIEGNLDHTILDDVKVMLDQAQTQMIHRVSRALQTK